MNRRMTVSTAIVLAVLLTALVVTAAACGSTSGTTTTAAAPTTTATSASTTTSTAATETTAGTATTAGPATTAGALTIPSLAMTPELRAYLQQVAGLFQSLGSLPEATDPLSLDVSTVTDAQIQAAQEALSQVQSALDQMKALQPPAELAPFQAALVTGVQSEIGIANKAIDALKNKDQAAFDAAKAESDKLEAQMTQLFEQLAPLILGGTAAS